MNFKAEQFQWQEGTKCYVAEASELNLRPGQVPAVFNINGHEFTHSSTDKDIGEEDVVGWRYKPTPATLINSAAMGGVTVLIIND